MTAKDVFGVFRRWVIGFEQFIFKLCIWSFCFVAIFIS